MLASVDRRDGLNWPETSTLEERKRGSGTLLRVIDVHMWPKGPPKFGGHRQRGLHQHHTIEAPDQGNAIVPRDFVGGITDRKHVSRLVSGDRHRCSPVSGCAWHLTSDLVRRPTKSLAPGRGEAVRLTDRR